MSGSSLDDFLRDEGILEEVEATALKRVVALQLEDIIKKQRLKKTSVAQRMRTSRAALDRLLDPENTSVTLLTLNRAAHALGRKISIKLQPV
ncbi:MAG: Fis family transcriptional regulator [Chthoniobacterales bacterium]